MKKLKIGFMVIVLLIMSACSYDELKINDIDRYPQATGAYFSKMQDNIIREKGIIKQNDEYDFRCADLSKIDLSNILDINQCQFDSRTIWPSQLPDNFDPKTLLESGKEIGLNIQKLHQEGIGGQGVNIAIIDTALLVDHSEFKDRIKLYKEYNIDRDQPIEMHGTAVASIAVGSSVGVAPKANLYYLADTSIGDGGQMDLTNFANDIERLIKFNQNAKESDKIQIISLSIGANNNTLGKDKFDQAVKKAQENKITVLWVSNDPTISQYFGTGKELASSYDEVSSIRPAVFLKEDIDRNHELYQERLLIPMDQRTCASFTGRNDYFYQSIGGMSYVIPYVAGIYALALQVDPSISFEDFTSYAKATATTVSYQSDNQNIVFGKYIDGYKLIKAIQEKAKIT